jgi:hypothetical protein
MANIAARINGTVLVLAHPSLNGPAATRTPRPKDR